VLGEQLLATDVPSDEGVVVLWNVAGVELAEEAAQLKCLVGCGVVFDGECYVEAGAALGLAHGGKALPQASGTGEKVHDGYAVWGAFGHSAAPRLLLL